MIAFRPPRLALLATGLVAAVALVLAPTGAAFAEPDPPPSTGNEGETPLLRDVLERTGKQYLEAEGALNESKRRQLELVLQQGKLEKRVAEVQADYDARAAALKQAMGSALAA